MVCLTSATVGRVGWVGGKWRERPNAANRTVLQARLANDASEFQTFQTTSATFLPPHTKIGLEGSFFDSTRRWKTVCLCCDVVVGRKH